MLTSEIKLAISLALSARIPFVAYAQPGNKSVDFFADIAEGVIRSKRRFLVNSWSAGSADQYVIEDRADSRLAIDYIKGHDCNGRGAYSVWSETTDRRTYDSAVEEVIDYLNNHGGKVVISRTITGDAASIDWAEVADRYFALHDEAFRYIYFTPRHGAWLGASPELLLTVADGEFKTMALAGTRSAEDACEAWSGKNVAEQAMVRKYIVDRLYDLGLNPHCSPTETMTTGNIQHLLTVITGRIDTCSPEEILMALNPTPALAGYPLAPALEQIAANEHHPRRCYGGYVAIDEPACFAAYVNLRCVNFDNRRWCMYVGSGIMPDSDVEDEWNETEAKSLILKKLITDSHK